MHHQSGRLLLPVATLLTLASSGPRCAATDPAEPVAPTAPAASDETTSTATRALQQPMRAADGSLGDGYVVWESNRSGNFRGRCHAPLAALVAGAGGAGRAPTS